jgi:hypothetical protein
MGLSGDNGQWTMDNGPRRAGTFSNGQWTGRGIGRLVTRFKRVIFATKRNISQQSATNGPHGSSKILSLSPQTAAYRRKGSQTNQGSRGQARHRFSCGHTSIVLTVPCCARDLGTEGLRETARTSQLGLVVDSPLSCRNAKKPKLKQKRRGGRTRKKLKGKRKRAG